jgi:hypothetical protein
MKWIWKFVVTGIDYHLIRYILWPLITKFATTHLYLRLRHGFRQTEVVFRAPTGRRYDQIMSLPPDQCKHAWDQALIQATNKHLGATQDLTLDPHPGIFAISHQHTHTSWKLKVYTI